jgi:hypothetical protein
MQEVRRLGAGLDIHDFLSFVTLHRSRLGIPITGQAKPAKRSIRVQEGLVAEQTSLQMQ